MCGRYGLANPARVLDLPAEGSPLGEALLAPIAAAEPRWNIAPSSVVPAIVADAGGVRSARLSWGLVPCWAKDRAIGHRLANARDDSVRHKPAFRHAFRARRALVFADLFYEWQVVAARRTKQPWCLRLPGDRPFAFAALWERWHDPADREGPALETFTLITTRPNDTLAPIHDRMPVLLAAHDHARWLDLTASLDTVEALLAPWHGAPISAVAIGTRVNDPRHDAPDCLAPVTPVAS